MYKFNTIGVVREQLVMNYKFGGSKMKTVKLARIHQNMAHNATKNQAINILISTVKIYYKHTHTSGCFACIDFAESLSCKKYVQAPLYEAKANTVERERTSFASDVFRNRR